MRVQRPSPERQSPCFLVSRGGRRVYPLPGVPTALDRRGSTEFEVRHRFQPATFSYQLVAGDKRLYLPEQSHQLQSCCEDYTRFRWKAPSTKSGPLSRNTLDRSRGWRTPSQLSITKAGRQSVLKTRAYSFKLNSCEHKLCHGASTEDTQMNTAASHTVNNPLPPMDSVLQTFP